MKNTLKKIVLEGLAILITLAIAFVIILFLFTQNVGQVTYDTLSGNVNKTPITISSPSYGQILTLPVMEGDLVKKGQILATLHVLTQNSIPGQSDLYHMNGMTLTVHSPSDGLIGQIAFAPLSTVAGASTLMQLYTEDSLEIQVLLPATTTLQNYTAFYAAHVPDTQRYVLHIVKQIPTNILSNIDPTTSVYRATCEHCQALLNDEGIAIYAQKKQRQTPFYATLISWRHALHF